MLLMLLLYYMLAMRGIVKLWKTEKRAGWLSFALADSLLDVCLRGLQHFADPSEALLVVSDDPGQVHRDIFRLDSEFFLALRARNEKHEFCLFHKRIAHG